MNNWTYFEKDNSWKPKENARKLNISLKPKVGLSKSENDCFFQHLGTWIYLMQTIPHDTVHCLQLGWKLDFPNLYRMNLPTTETAYGVLEEEVTPPNWAMQE